MDFRLVEMASKQTDVLFNLFSMKMKYLIRDQTCENCKQPVQEWFLISVCHNTLCEKCLEHVNLRGSNFCPVCSTMFDPKQDIITSKNMKKSYGQIEEFLFSLLSLEKETSDVLYNGNESDSRALKPGIIHLKSVELEPVFKEKRNISDKVEKNMKAAKHEQNLETISMDEIQSNNVVIDSNKNSSHDCDMSDGQSYYNLSSGSDSDDNMVHGTPNRVLAVSDPKNTFNRKDICITYSNFGAKELNVITKFYEMFKVRVTVDWSDEVTHLIIKLNEDGTYARTRKCINAILSHCSIVTVEWALMSIKEKNILPEQDFMPLDECGEASVLRSWRIGRGIVNSSMLWAERCTLYFHSSVVTHEYFTAFKGWALKVGFTVIELMEEFNSIESDLRIILTDFRNPTKEINTAADLELMNWLKAFKAITVHLDWYLDVLCRYRFVLIEPHYQVLKLNFSMITFADVNESVISVEDNN